MKKESIQIKIKRIISSIKIYNLKIKEYNTCEYIIILIYILSKDGKIALIYREIYIIDNLFAKIFIEINIIKSEDIVLDINKDLIIIGLYNFL